MEFVRGVDHIGITVTDLERSIGFYTSILECSIVMRQEKEGGYLAAIVGYPDAHVLMTHLQPPGGGPRIELFQYLVPESEVRDLEPLNVGNAHICFVVEDLAALYERLVEKGISTISPPVEVDTGVNTGGWSLYLYDPDGITLELFQRSTRSPANVE
jgi:catechol 2,3-dioxygenase-like lactoylglutathione lyase family enzyme